MKIRLVCLGLKPVLYLDMNVIRLVLTLLKSALTLNLTSLNRARTELGIGAKSSASLTLIGGSLQICAQGMHQRVLIWVVGVAIDPTCVEGKLTST